MAAAAVKKLGPFLVIRSGVGDEVLIVDVRDGEVMSDETGTGTLLEALDELATALVPEQQ